jgi:neutral trehalase
LPAFYQDLVNPTTSSINTGQQWDKPNVWAPNNWILHEVTDSLSAYNLAQQWVKTTYCSWKKTGNLYEKYRNDAIG